MKEINNKKAYHDFEIIEKIEAGIILEGNEVKSIREGKMNLKGSFCKFFKNKLFLVDAHISKYSSANSFTDINETRPRELLLKKKELVKLQEKVSREGLSIVPILVYSNKGTKIKVEIALAKGKKNYDKRVADKESTLKKEASQY